VPHGELDKDKEGSCAHTAAPRHYGRDRPPGRGGVGLRQSCGDPAVDGSRGKSAIPAELSMQHLERWSCSARLLREGEPTRSAALSARCQGTRYSSFGRTAERLTFRHGRKAANRHGSAEIRDSTSAQLVRSRLPFRVEARASENVCDVRRAKFAKTFAALLALSVIFCVVMGTMRREALFGPMLTHWDEAAAYAVIGRLVSVLS
jgi:hypothetical protein